MKKMVTLTGAVLCMALLFSAQTLCAQTDKIANLSSNLLKQAVDENIDLAISSQDSLQAAQFLSQHPEVRKTLEASSKEHARIILAEERVCLFVALLQKHPEVLDLLAQNPAVTALLAEQLQIITVMQAWPVFITHLQENPALVKKLRANPKIGFVLLDKIAEMENLIESL